MDLANDGHAPSERQRSEEAIGTGEVRAHADVNAREADRSWPHYCRIIDARVRGAISIPQSLVLCPRNTRQCQRAQSTREVTQGATQFPTPRARLNSAGPGFPTGCLLHIEAQADYLNGSREQAGTNYGLWLPELPYRRCAYAR